MPETSMFEEFLAMIGGENDHCVVKPTPWAQFGKKRSQLIVEESDLCIVTSTKSRTLRGAMVSQVWRVGIPIH